MHLGERLKFIREEVAGMSQSQLSRLSGVRQATISEIEHQKTSGITLLNARRLAQTLGVSMDVLLKGVDLEGMLWPVLKHRPELTAC